MSLKAHKLENAFLLAIMYMNIHMSKKEQHIESLDFVKPSKGYRFFKRMFDVLVSIIGILAISWLLIILLILATLTSHGTGIYKDTRIGKDFKIFHVYKFRSMFADVDKNPDKYINRAQRNKLRKERKLENDPRVTRFGRFLRKSSLDELPQLFNVLTGTMSFIGPRPITEMELKMYFTVSEQKILLSARPGLISYWGVKGRSDVDFANGERQKLELEYFKLRGFWFDASLIFRAIPVVVKGTGAR